MMENWNDGKKLPSEALEEANVATLKKNLLFRQIQTERNLYNPPGKQPIVGQGTLNYLTLTQYASPGRREP